MYICTWAYSCTQCAAATGQDYDERVDVYSVGIMVAEIILGYMFDTIQLPAQYQAPPATTQKFMIRDAVALIAPICPVIADLIQACTRPVLLVPDPAADDRITAQQAITLMKAASGGAVPAAFVSPVS